MGEKGGKKKKRIPTMMIDRFKEKGLRKKKMGEKKKRRRKKKRKESKQ